jgi:hypothetical protein
VPIAYHLSVTSSINNIRFFHRCINVVVEGAYFLVGAAEEACFRVEAAVGHQCGQEAVVGDCRNLRRREVLQIHHLAVPAGVDLYSLQEELPAGVPVVVAEHDLESLVQALLDSSAEVDLDSLVGADLDALVGVDPDAPVEADLDALVEADLDALVEADLDALVEADLDSLVEAAAFAEACS